MASTAIGLGRRPLRAALRLIARIFGGLLLALYYFVTRALIAVLAAYLVLYFLVSSGPVKQAVQTMVADALPGSMTAATLQWGPLPWHLRLADVRIHGARGEDVAVVRAVEVTIDWPGTASGLFAYLSDPDKNPLALRFHRVDLLDPWARIEVDRDYNVGIERAFVIDDGAPALPGPPAPDLDIRVAVVRVINGGALVTAPGFHLDAIGAHAVTDFALLGRDGHMFYDAPRTTVARVDMRFDAFGHLPSPLALTATDLVVDDFAWRELGFSWRHAAGHIPGGTFEGYGQLDASKEVPPWQGGGRIDLEPGAPVLAELLRDEVLGPVTLAIAGGGDVERVDTTWQVESPWLSIGGRDFTDLVARGRVSPRGTLQPDDPETRLHAIHIDELQAGLGGGRLRLSEFSYEPWRVPNRPSTRDLMTRVELTDVDARALSWPFNLPSPRVTGEALVGSLSRPSGDNLTVDLSPSTLVFTQAPLAGLPLSWTLEGVAQERTGVPPDPARASGVPARTLIDLSGLQVDGGDMRARLAGSIDLTTGALDLEPYLRLGSVTPLARALANREVALADLPSGRLVLKAARLTGTISDPELSATINWTNARTSSRDLGQISGALNLTNGVLSTRDLESRTPVVDVSGDERPRRRLAGRFRLDGRVALFAPGTSGSDWPASLTTRPFSLSVKNVEGLVVGAFTDTLGPEARLAITDASLSGTLEDPVATLSGRGRVMLTEVALAGERHLSLAGIFAVAPGLGLKLLDAEVLFANGARWEGEVAIDPGSAPLSQRPLSARLDLGQTPIEGLAFAAMAPDLSGSLRGKLSIGGALARPSVIGTLGIDGLRLGHLALGSAELSVTTRTLSSGRRLVELSAFDDAFFPGYSLERAQLTLEGAVPRRFEAAIEVADQDLAVLVPQLAVDGLSLRGDLAAEIDADLVTGLTAFRLRAPPEGLSLLLGNRREPWTNQAELLLVSDGRHVTLFPTRIVPASRTPRSSGNDTASRPRALPEDDLGLEACGSLDLRTLALDLQAAMNLELAMAPGLAVLMSVARGRFSSRPDTAAQAIVGDATCLSRTDFLHVGGTLTTPAPTGRLETRGLALVPRGSGRELRLRDGSAVLVSSVAGRTRLELGSDGTRFEGDLDDGTFGLAGHIDLIDWRPDSLDMRVVGADLFLQSPGEFAITASPLGHIVASDLMSDPLIAISGDLSVSEGRFSKSFDTFARALSGAIGVRGETSTTSVLDSLPWLGAARLDVNVLANDFAIQTALPLARTDLRARLDLTLRGTVSSPLLYRRVDILPGGTLSYFVFERTFLVSQGSIDFDGDPERPLVDVTAQTQITYLQRAQTALQEEDEKEVGVTLRMTGRVPDLKIELSSDDATLDQADIQSLLITGKPRGDLDRAQESQLVSADLANVINTVLSAPFVRRASVGVDQKGGLEYRVGTCFAPGLCFDTTTVSDDTETTLRAKFSLAIGDDVVCEGTLKRSDGAATATQDTYQARCRYRIPLE